MRVVVGRVDVDGEAIVVCGVRFGVCDVCYL